jgi:hypothetical protein
MFYVIVTPGVTNVCNLCMHETVFSCIVQGRVERRCLLNARFEGRPDAKVYERSRVCSSDMRADKVIPVIDCGHYRYRTEVICLSIPQTAFSLKHP